jgi:nucleoside-diphosphate-sugar epimerase
MNILILGGTQMLGRDLVETMLETRNDRIVLANRGITNPNLFPNCTHITIDRDNNESCSSLSGLNNDVVVDFSCYNISQFKNTAQYIKNTKKYILISTMSVLENNLTDMNDSYIRYAIMKRELENNIKFSTDISSIIIVRPCAIYGDNDYTNRFEKINGEFYWKNTRVKANRSSGCLSVKDLSNRLLSIIDTPFVSNLEIINIIE